MAQLNTVVLDGNRVTLGELRHGCDTIPFMVECRLVIVYGLLSRLAPGSKARGEAAAREEEPPQKPTWLGDLVAYLPQLPPTTRLVFVEDRSLAPSHPVLKLAEAESKQKQASVKLFQPPKDWELPRWIQQRARNKGGEISGEATALLAALVGNALRLLDQEIDKLLLYADGRTVTAQDVQALVSYAREASIFELVDHVGRRETDRALRLLHHLLDEGEPSLYLLAMLTRQIRILIQVSELQAQRRSPKEIADRLKVHSYVVEKGIAQARNFRMDQLEQAYLHLVETDWRIKTGDLEEVLALDMLVVTLAHL